MRGERLTAAEEYRILRDFGMARSAARIQTLVNAVRGDEMDRVAGGLTYNRDEVQVAIVHARQDVVATIGHLSELHRTLRSVRRWLILLTLAVIWLVLSLT